MDNFKPSIIGFCGNWCTCSGADIGGISRIQCPPNLRMLRLMGSEAVGLLHILETFQPGTDGVFIGGGHPGDCHYMEGNYKILRRILILEKPLSQFGIEPERLRLELVSASEGDKFDDIIKDFGEASLKP